MPQSFHRFVLSVGSLPKGDILNISSDNKPGFVDMGPTEIEERQGLMDDGNGVIDENLPIAYPAWRRDPLRRCRRRWNPMKLVATIGWIGLMSYGVIKFVDSEYFLVRLESPFLTPKPCCQTSRTNHVPHTRKRLPSVTRRNVFTQHRRS